MDSLIVEGFKIDKSKSLKENVVSNMEQTLGICLFESEIKKVKRFGPDGDDGLPKHLIITFYDPEVKSNLMRLKGRLCTTDVYFREQLTQRQNDIFIQAKQAKKNRLLHNAWSKDGQILGVEHPESKPTLIHDLDYLIQANSAFAPSQHQNPGAAAAMETDGQQTGQQSVHRQPPHTGRGATHGHQNHLNNNHQYNQGPHWQSQTERPAWQTPRNNRGNHRRGRPTMFDCPTRRVTNFNPPGGAQYGNQYGNQRHDARASHIGPGNHPRQRQQSGNPASRDDGQHPNRGQTGNEQQQMRHSPNAPKPQENMTAQSAPPIADRLMGLSGLPGSGGALPA